MKRTSHEQDGDEAAWLHILARRRRREEQEDDE